MADYFKAPLIPSDFIWRRAHSLTGLWLVLFLMEHLFTNSQAALFFGDDGNGFVRAVNGLKNLPYLPIIEMVLLGIPFLIHGIWGVKYLLTSKINSFPSDGSTPSLGQYGKNRAYTWQRITSWILLFGILAHVVHMRFLEYPESAQKGTEHFYMIRLNQDNGLYTLSKRLNFEIYDEAQLVALKGKLPKIAASESILSTPDQLIKAQEIKENEKWLQALEKTAPQIGQVVAVSPSFGTAELLMVRDTFKNPIMIFLYTGLVLAACFHAFNGLWTGMITWGVTLTHAAQTLMRKIAIGLMVIIASLGLVTIWGTYWFNLYQ